METKITIKDELIEDIIAYTHTSSINEAVNVALKDWMLFYRMREMSKKMVASPVPMSGRQPLRKIRMR